MNITFAITAFNEQQRGNYEWIRECLRVPMEHPCINEVLVYDDGSQCQRDLYREITDPKNDKLTIVLGRKNLGVYGAKIEAIAHASGEWVITMDSDNHVEPDVLSMLSIMPRDLETWYLPSFAMPAFDYRHIIGKWSMQDIHVACALDRFDCLINTGNQMVHRANFMETFGSERGRILDAANGATDSMMFNDKWLRSGRVLNCISGFHYHHRVGIGKASNYHRAPADKERLGRELISKLNRDSVELSQ